MHQETLFFQIMIYLAAAVISVPIARKMGLGSVLGYLLAGILIGPYVFKLVGQEGTDVMHFAEFGVVIMLFLIGLELHPSMLWRMKKLIFGLGGLQVGLTTLFFALITKIFWEFNLAQAITVGLIFSLSSTAIVLQTFSERKLLSTTSGQFGFSVLLFQDLSVIPIMALLALFANQVLNEQVLERVEEVYLFGQAGWQRLLLIVLMGTGIIIGGRFLAHYIFRFIADARLREIFTASALLLVIAIAFAMNYVGLSPALGTFLAGVVLANSEYRHELESNLEPFKGLLLGVFFITVGASIDFDLLIQHGFIIGVMLTLLILIKFGVLFFLGHLFGLRPSQNMFFSFSLSQAGEFGFVLTSFASSNAIFDTQTSGILLIVVSLSMLLTPLLFIINEKWIQPLYSESPDVSTCESVEETDNPVVIAGFGRLGMVLGRFLIANGVKVTMLDYNPHNIRYLKKYGYKIYYGDVTRSDLLESAGIMNAKTLIITLGDREQINKLVALAQYRYPHLKLIVRAVDIAHSLELRNKKVDALRQETFYSAVELGVDSLLSIGFSENQARRSAYLFKKMDSEFMNELETHYTLEDPHFIMEQKRFSELLENKLLSQQKRVRIQLSDEEKEQTGIRATNNQDSKDNTSVK
jgi:monovalent cation:proton antiporter-2 (CPA2) family protein